MTQRKKRKEKQIENIPESKPENIPEKGGHFTNRLPEQKQINVNSWIQFRHAPLATRIKEGK